MLNPSWDDLKPPTHFLWLETTNQFGDMFVDMIWRLRFYFVYLYRGIAVPLVFHSKHSLSSVQDLQAVARLHEVF